MFSSMARRLRRHLIRDGKVRLVYALLGASLMVLIMHPVIEGIHLWRSEQTSGDLWRDLIVNPIKASFRPGMLPMTGWLALAGAGVGSLFAFLHTRLQLRRKSTRMTWTEHGLRTLINEGENETLEFKSSLRWDLHQGKVNKALERVIAKSICGLLNHRGGYLLIGVDDDGQPTGIEHDLETLSHPNWDGFKRCLVSIVTAHLGKHHCTHLHFHQLTMDGRMIAMVQVDSAPEPVYCRFGNAEHYFVRTGNATQELDVREAVAHIAERHSHV